MRPPPSPTTWSRPTLSPTRQLSSATMPSAGAASDSSIFIDSSTTTGRPASTSSPTARGTSSTGRASAPAGRRRRARGAPPRPSPRRTRHAQPVVAEPVHARRRRDVRRSVGAALDVARRRARRRAARRRRRRASSSDGARTPPRRQPSRRANGSSPARSAAARCATARPRGDLARRSAAASAGSSAPDQPGVHLPRADVVAGEQRAQEAGRWWSAPRIAVSASARSRRASAVARSRAVGDHLGDHRVVVGADDAAGLDRGVDAHAAPGSAPAAPARRTGRSCGVLGVDARLDRVAVQRDARRRAASPAATRSCSSTRSRPVTSSVTGCSTCSRAFISRKKCVDGSSASAMNSTVPAPV